MANTHIMLSHSNNAQIKYQKYYEQLKGFTIESFSFNEDEYSLSPFPCFVLKKGDQKLVIEVSMDEEGNGGGFLFIGSNPSVEDYIESEANNG